VKAIAINAGPRKKWNTAQLLEAALQGAEEAGAQTEFIHLIDVKYSGCISCFSCKKLDASGQTTHFCFVKDGLTPILEKILDADAVFIGSPIYIGDVTGMFRNLYERLTFMMLSYGTFSNTFEGKINFGLFYSTNAPQEAVEKMYYPMFDGHKGMLERLYHGTCAFYAATDTLQFDDYSKYDGAMFNVEAKRSRHESQFPVDLAAAREIAKKLLV